VWEAVRSDWRTAPVEPQLRATLGFLEKLTLHPEELSEADAEAVLSEGVTVGALVDAIHVTALFSMIVRLADAFGWHVPPREAHMARAGPNLESGYVLLTPDDVGA
jgi:alkylhydroperoxidase family enzyme